MLGDKEEREGIWGQLKEMLRGIVNFETGSRVCG